MHPYDTKKSRLLIKEEDINKMCVKVQKGAFYTCISEQAKRYRTANYTTCKRCKSFWCAKSGVAMIGMLFLIIQDHQNYSI